MHQFGQSLTSDCWGWSAWDS